MAVQARYDVFISHASEDKHEVARPLAALLLQAGIKVWLDEFELRLGDSLRRKIDAGLSASAFGVVVLSKAFFEKEWPKKELDALVAREDGLSKVILPVWHRVSATDIRAFSPLLADRLGVGTEGGIQRVAHSVVDAIRHASGKEGDAGESKIEGPASIQELIVKLLDDLQDRADNPADIFGLPTGFYDLDRLLGGLMPGGLYILAGRPAMGITTLAFNIAQNISLQEGLPALYVSSTAPAAEMSNRLIASVGRISRSRLVSGKLTDEEWPRLTEAVENVRDIPIYFDNGTGLTLAAVLEHSRALAAQLGKLGLVVVDGVDSLVDVPNYEGLQGAIRQLSLLARELDCPVIVLLCALGQVEGRLDKRPLIQDLPAAEAIERHAHAVCCLYRDEYYHRETSREPGVAELIVLRNRGGPVGTVKLAFLRNISRFENLA